MTNPMTIAIDGPAAAGKTTVGKLVADQFNAIAFDTGILYRAVARAVSDQHVDPGDELAVQRVATSIQIDVREPSVHDGRFQDVLIDGVDQSAQLRTPEIERILPQISANPGVRKALLEEQRRIADAGNIVMIGRDIGTVIIPDARFKFFLDADVDERARRRYTELARKGVDVARVDVLRDMRERDHRDATRSLAPLQMAADAIPINTDGLTAEEAAAIIVQCVNLRNSACSSDGDSSQ